MQKPIKQNRSPRDLEEAQALYKRALELTGDSALQTAIALGVSPWMLYRIRDKRTPQKAHLRVFREAVGRLERYRAGETDRQTDRQTDGQTDGQP